MAHKDLAAYFAAVMVAACGRSSPVGPTPVKEARVNQTPLPPQPPSFLLGYFAVSSDVPEVEHANVVLVIPSYSDDPAAVAASLRARHQVAIVSAHHVFGSARERWDAEWKATQRWMEPLAGLVVAVYVVDEPAQNGVPEARVAEALGIVRAAGYRTMIAESYNWARRLPRPAVDWYGFTCYEGAGVGYVAQSRCLDLESDPRFDIVIGQAADYGSGYTDQAAWYETAKRERKRGLVWWCWDFPDTDGARDSAAILAEHARIAEKEGL